MSLSDHKSPWSMDLYLAVDREIPDAENTSFSGKYFCKVYEGPYKNAGKWCEDFHAITAKRSIKAKNPFLWYTTCPKCAKKYGKNYVILIGDTC